ncbi:MULTISPECIES: hypothetical protein [Amycolatopsis]|uniref:Uncharacterized protein n=1 Tax=Amycolatopsis dendrobii TaxID=2760662 RepID=A0A7W3ZAJ5_9PSEU|nr:MULTISPECIES: hypothetical protein [Amycolatopsis]MBB1153884.1 hypothetical protein [Amycolatopsis dendrobii]UKD51666.1 hypothetical protein L3Q65_27475 [Amycolatopsis sp. FU40]
MYPLAEGEQLLWSGRPQRYVRRYRDYHYYLTVGILLLVVSVLIATLNLSYWVMVGWIAVLSLVFNGGIERNRERRGFIAVTTYLVTDRRLIFVSESPPGAEFRWVQLADLRPPRVRDHGDGTGTIDFHPTVSEWLRDQGFRSRPAWYPILPELMAVPDAAHVADLISRNAPRAPVVG